MSKRSREKRLHKQPVRLNLRRVLANLPRAACADPEKVRYRSRKHAETAAETQWRDHRRILVAYPCSDHYHLKTLKETAR